MNRSLEGDRESIIRTMAIGKEILPRLLKLPVAERAELAGELIRSLDAADDQNTAKAWALELEKRVNDVVSGKVKTESWTKVRSRIEAKLRARQG